MFCALCKCLSTFTYRPCCPKSASRQHAFAAGNGRLAGPCPFPDPQIPLARWLCRKCSAGSCRSSLDHSENGLIIYSYCLAYKKRLALWVGIGHDATAKRSIISLVDLVEKCLTASVKSVVCHKTGINRAFSNDVGDQCEDRACNKLTGCSHHANIIPAKSISIQHLIQMCGLLKEKDLENVLNKTSENFS